MVTLGWHVFFWSWKNINKKTGAPTGFKLTNSKITNSKFSITIFYVF